MTDPGPAVPRAPRRPLERTHHGDTVVDAYDWLRDKDDPETIAYLEAENAWAEDTTAHLADLREQIFTEIKERTLETDMSVPVRHDRWWYYSRTVEGSQYAIRCRAPIAGPDDWDPPTVEVGSTIAGEEVLLDSNVEAEGHEFFSLGAFSISDDGDLLAWSVDTAGDERYTIRVKRISTGEVLPDAVEGAAPGATWSRDGRHLFYVTVDDAWRPHRVWRHELGSTAEDTLVFEEPDERFFVGVGRSSSERFLMIAVGSKITSEVRLLDADDPTGEFTIVWPRREGIDYSVEHLVVGGRDRLAILHNDGAVNFELVLAPLEDPTDTTVLVPGSDELRLEGADAFARHLVLSYRRDATTRLALMPIHDDGIGDMQELEFDAELFTCGLGGNAEWDPRYLRIGYASYVEPATIWDLDPATGERLLRRRATVLGDFDPADYEQHRSWVRAEDGALVPLSIVCRRGTPRDGTAPAMIYGYGSYEISLDPDFSISRLSLLDRGFVYAVAHVRGGGELGRRWYDDGKQLAKRNTFTDFVSCARHLADEGWTSPDRLVAEGGSAGGLLMGAVANLAPDAFAGIFADVPFVDPLTTILDPSLPLTVIEWDEWGDPLHDAEVYAYMKGYTPYENVADLPYPKILAGTSLNDTRVLYVEPAKWVARLREVTGAEREVLLRTEMSAGHGGVSGRYAAWRQRAWELAWIIDTATAATGAKPRMS
ncbi:S9 family peptidase [Aeromicrobium sp.]|uniref:S9 family peptidase n=1 Tax=Aeromicrobium sp. TaxID=1871063 RepID=UPI0028ACB4FF|nr:S9 family peptidase [Aeromicrobium sp.]